MYPQVEQVKSRVAAILSDPVTPEELSQMERRARSNLTICSGPREDVLRLVGEVRRLQALLEKK